MRDILPPAVYESVRKHLAARARVAIEGWESGADDEDVLTGDLGATLRTGWRSVHLRGASGWRWRVSYKKFRGRGPGAFEKSSGADGIFQVEITSETDKIFKGLLFQAKRTRSSHAKLLLQVDRMEKIAENGSAIWFYEPSGYLALPGAAYLVAPEYKVLEPLDSFLSETFLSCATGLRGMYFDAVRGLLLLPNGFAHRVTLRHKITVEIETPGARQ